MAGKANSGSKQRKGGKKRIVVADLTPKAQDPKGGAALGYGGKLSGGVEG